ncbi:hypothetical protein GGD83_003324 [Rhodoblastus sphagnicola]|nr:hypothetical protein [Rhodoblastus sphagnicola]
MFLRNMKEIQSLVLTHFLNANRCPLRLKMLYRAGAGSAGAGGVGCGAGC